MSTWHEVGKRNIAKRSALVGGRGLQLVDEHVYLLDLAELSSAYVDARKYSEAKKFAQVVIDGSKSAPTLIVQPMLASASESLARIYIAERNGVAALEYLRRYGEAISPGRSPSPEPSPRTPLIAL